MASKLHLEPQSAGLYLQKRSIRTCRGYGVGTEVSLSEGCGQGNAKSWVCYDL